MSVSFSALRNCFSYDIDDDDDYDYDDDDDALRLVQLTFIPSKVAT